MGTTTNAILAYGIALNDYEDTMYKELPFAGDTEDFDELICRLAGLPLYGEEGHDFAKNRAAVSAFPLELVQHCHWDFPQYILAVRGTVQTAARGRPVALNGALPVVSNEGIRMLNEWCDKYSLEKGWDWYLCSYWA